MMRSSPRQPRAAPHERNEHGVTLVEAIVVLGIVALLTAVAVPFFDSLLQRHRLSTTVNDFLSAVLFTRTEALRRGDPVHLIPVDGINWTSGWIVLVDRNRNQRADSGEEIVARYPGPPSGIGIDDAFSAGTRHYLAYTGSGRSGDATGNGQRYGHFLFSSSAGQRLISINALGRARVCIPASPVDTTC
jgi:type IV fimbrial biogenesis protein FimT